MDIWVISLEAFVLSGSNHHSDASHSGHGHKHGDDLFKRNVFFLVGLAIVIVAFLVFRYQGFLLSNLYWLVPLVVVLYLIAKYDYILKLLEYERAVVFTFGKVSRVAGPGWTVVFPPFEKYVVVDLRTKTVDIPKQEVVTKDNIEVTVDAVVYLKINSDNQSIINSVTKIDDYILASKQYMIGLIRDKAGSYNVGELISDIEGLNKDIRQRLENLAVNWGVNVEEAVIKDIQLPRSVLDSMHEKQAATQRKLARMESAEAHKAEIEAVRAAAEQLNDKALAYYYVRALEKLGEGKSTKFIFPMELSELAKTIMKKDYDSSELADLLKKYAPVVQSIVGRKVKAKQVRVAKKSK